MVRREVMVSLTVESRGFGGKWVRRIFKLTPRSGLERLHGHVAHSSSHALIALNLGRSVMVVWSMWPVGSREQRLKESGSKRLTI